MALGQSFRDSPFLSLLLPLLIFWIFNSVFMTRQPFATSSYEYVSWKEYEHLLRTRKVRDAAPDTTTPLCPPLPPQSNPNPVTKLQSNVTFWGEEDMELDEESLATQLNIQIGGRWKPSNCIPVHHLVIIVPYRERSDQLKKFLIYMHNFLQLQFLSYKIFVIEQADQLPFNRGKLFNIGFHIASKEDPELFCFIFHDVDLLPESLFNVYSCAQRPRHMSSIINSFRYTLLYPNLFGGATTITRDVFEDVNGFSNRFFGWGGEDDDFYLNRLQAKGVDIIRLSPSISSYRMLSHKKELPSTEREEVLTDGKSKSTSAYEGLNNLNYQIMNHIASSLYTLVQVTI